ncbi:MAG: SDR family oxidoreductase [Anaerolineae bacterium]|nr:SDR family oxidoreductase [Anaerolineae bacterium]
MTNSKTVLVTGSSTGFGRATAETLARAGYHVFASMRNVTGKNAGASDALRHLATREKLALEVIELDVTDDVCVDLAVSQIIETTGHIDVLVNNAGTMIMGPSEAVTVDQAHGLFETNFFGAMRMNRAVLPYMRQRKSGLIVQISSIVGRIAFPLMGIYAASKFALEALAETYHYELARLGIDSVVIEPGMYPTEMAVKIGTDKDAAPHDMERLQAYINLVGQIQGVIGPAMEAIMTSPDAPQPQDIADAVLNLVETPFGERPLRLVVGSLADPFDKNGEDNFTVKLNHTAEQIQNTLFDQMSILQLLSPEIR